VTTSGARALAEHRQPPSAATVVEGEFRNDLVYHAQMEPLNAVASVSSDGDACEVWCSVQSKTIAVTVAADALGIKPDKIVYNDMLMGAVSDVAVTATKNMSTTRWCCRTPLKSRSR
jgi:CO/xanthine dehydrogenase Mo-binding subunit